MWRLAHKLHVGPILIGAGSAGVVLGLLAATFTIPSVRGQSTSAALRVVQMAPGSPALDVLIDGQRAIPTLPFRAASPYLDVASGSRTLQLTPAGQTQPALLSVPLSLTAGEQQTVVVLRRPSGLGSLVLHDDNQPPPAGKAVVRFVHAAADVPAIDIAVSGASGPPLFSNVGFQGVAGPVSVAAGIYDLELRAAGTPTVLLDLPSVSLEAGAVLSIFTAGMRSDNSFTVVAVPYPARMAAPLPSSPVPASPVPANPAPQSTATPGVVAQGTPTMGIVLPVRVMPGSGSGGPPPRRLPTALLLITLGLACLLAGLGLCWQGARR